MVQEIRAAAQGPLSTPRLIAFSAMALPISATGLAMGVYLPQHFARNLGVDLGVVAAAFALIRLIDIPLDPMLGIAMDRTRTRVGRYRVWVMLGAPVMMVAVYMLFFAHPGATLAYLVGWLLVLYLGISMIGLSHSAWAASLAPGYQARARVFGIVTTVGIAGSLLVLSTPVLLNALGYDEDVFGVPGMGALVLALVPIALFSTVARTPEHVAAEGGDHRFQFHEYWSLITRPTMRRILAADLLLALGPGWMSAIYMFFYTQSRGYTAAQASFLLVFFLGAGLVGAPLMARLAGKVSKHRAVMVATTGYSLTIVTLLAMPKASIFFGALTSFSAGFFSAGFNVLLRAMTADVADEVRLDQGKERSGLLYALTQATNKIAGAFSIWMTFSVLQAVGFNPQRGAINSPEAIRALEIAFVSGPILFVMLGGLCMFGYSLGPARTAEIRRLLDEREIRLEREART